MKRGFIAFFGALCLPAALFAQERNLSGFELGKRIFDDAAVNEILDAIGTGTSAVRKWEWAAPRGADLRERREIPQLTISLVGNPAKELSTGVIETYRLMCLSGTTTCFAIDVRWVMSGPLITGWESNVQLAIDSIIASIGEEPDRFYVEPDSLYARND